MSKPQRKNRERNHIKGATCALQSMDYGGPEAGRSSG